MAQPTIRVAIIGGGLAGTILTNALLKHPHLDVHLYEANSEIKERGASIGLSINAQRAMCLLGLSEITIRAEAVKVGCLQLFVNEGPDDGKHIYDVDIGKETVHRAALLRELLAQISKDRIHLNKRLASVQDNTTITFTDGTSTVADVIIGADGIHSGVRKFVLGEGHPACNPVPAGFWDARTVVSYEQAVEKLGTLCINVADPHQHTHIGSKGILFHDFIDNGERICIVASGPISSDWDLTQWTHRVTREWLDEQYEGWGEYGRNGLDLLFNGQSSVGAFVEFESLPLPTFVNNNICIIGDAAHAMAPYQGSGLAQAIEDSLILETVLDCLVNIIFAGKCQTPNQISLALQIYDRIRRPHSQKVVESSRKAAEAYFSAHAGGVEALRREIPSREYILEWDTEGAVRRAEMEFEDNVKVLG